MLAIGGTNGLGRAVAKAAASHGATVTVAGRTFRDENIPNMKFIKCDLSSMKDAKRIGELVSEKPNHWDLVLMTTGIVPPVKREATEEGTCHYPFIHYLFSCDFNALLILY